MVGSCPVHQHLVAVGDGDPYVGSAAVRQACVGQLHAFARYEANGTQRYLQVIAGHDETQREVYSAIVGQDQPVTSHDPVVVWFW